MAAPAFANLVIDMHYITAVPTMHRKELSVS